MLEVRIDPLTGAFHTEEIARTSSTSSSSKKKLSVDIPQRCSEDDGIGSLPHTPTGYASSCAGSGIMRRSVWS